MSDPLSDAAIYISLAIVIYYFLLALLTPSEGAGVWGQYLAWFFAFLLIAYIGYLIWTQTRKKTPVNTKVNETKDEEDFDKEAEELDKQLEAEFAQANFSMNSEKGGDEISENYRVQRQKFSLSDQPVIEDDGVITYDYFKRWYLGPEYLAQYTQSVKQALLIKKRLLLTLRKQFRTDLIALQPKDKPNDPLSKLYQTVDSRTDDTAMLTKAVGEIDHLLREIKRRLETLSVEVTRKNLVSALNHPEDGLETITGHTQIKNFIALELYTFAQNPRTFLSNFQHVILKGPSGIGKTKLAKVIGHVYAASGILIRNSVHIITKEALTTPYVNQSAKQTRKFFLSALESVVFIDEAYDLAPQSTLYGKSVDHGSEAIAQMLTLIGEMKGLGIVIAAGYEKDMNERFIPANEGIDRRFPHKFTLESYSSADLTTILLRFLTKTCPDVKFTRKINDYIFTMIDTIYSQKPEIFEKQAGDMENLSGSISRSIYGSRQRKWPEQSTEIVLSGFNAYLAGKGHSLKLK